MADKEPTTAPIEDRIVAGLEKLSPASLEAVMKTITYRILCQLPNEEVMLEMCINCETSILKRRTEHRHDTCPDCGGVMGYFPLKK